MSITLLILIILAVSIFVGGKVYLENKAEEVEKEINNSIGEAVKDVELPVVEPVAEKLVSFEQTTEVKPIEVVEKVEVKKEAKKKRGPNKKTLNVKKKNK